MTVMNQMQIMIPNPPRITALIGTQHHDYNTAAPSWEYHPTDCWQYLGVGVVCRGQKPIGSRQLHFWRRI